MENSREVWLIRRDGWMRRHVIAWPLPPVVHTTEFREGNPEAGIVILDDPPIHWAPTMKTRTFSCCSLKVPGPMGEQHWYEEV